MGHTVYQLKLFWGAFMVIDVTGGSWMVSFDLGSSLDVEDTTDLDALISEHRVPAQLLRMGGCRYTEQSPCSAVKDGRI